MNNGEFYQALDRRIERLEDKLDERVDVLFSKIGANFDSFDKKLDRLFSERNAICQAHDDRIDSIETQVAIYDDRHKQHEKKRKNWFH